MAWSLAGETIHVDNDSDDDAEPIYGRIQILNASGTTLHFAGSRSANRTLKFWCETDARLSTLRTASNTNADVALVSDLGAQGNYRIIKLSPERRHAVNKANAWFYCTAELMKR